MKNHRGNAIGYKGGNQMKTKKLLIATLAISMTLIVVASPVKGVNNTGETALTYDSRNHIPDPDHPEQPKWAVVIPSAIYFTDSDKVVDVGVELVDKNSGLVPDTEVTVEVTSANGYKLKNGTDEISYALVYGTTTMSGTKSEVAKLKLGSEKKEGQAILGNDKASSDGTYTDILEYTVSNTQP